MNAPENIPFETASLPERLDGIAPDGSEIRLLVKSRRGSLVHCQLPPSVVSQAVVHRSVEELWYFLSGSGQVWRKREDQEQITVVQPGLSLSLPTGTIFQFRNTGQEPLCFVIVTMPPWPGEGEAIPSQGIWQSLK